MINPVLHQTDGLPAYQQVLDRFALSDLLLRLKTYFDAVGVSLESQEIEVLAAILIQTLTANLNDSLLASYLEAIRHNKFEALSNLSNLKLPSASISLPTNFPDVEIPQFLYGDRLQWLSNGEATDWGVVIGRFYSFAPHSCRWTWCYLLWLDPNSLSSNWISADIAWEEDLEPMEVGKFQ
ncbi:hypothetical protein H6F93_20175 [Leptolyngbya sp. FACHB-671]|uniref:hypothetical protein n=1 Tax=Leptolyngbya sp. FACHB-671 TaxID=2692812 RepID=UPI0016897E37|nr:hypothetical protein [Leptolyngbya sp. FACHB-671]MBD2069801.1 hypothetical protein [Leptolyngbya sp. FACHB-671]